MNITENVEVMFEDVDTGEELLLMYDYEIEEDEEDDSKTLHVFNVRGHQNTDVPLTEILQWLVEYTEDKLVDMWMDSIDRNIHSNIIRLN